MTSKEMAYQYRLSQWSALAQERGELGISIRAFCAMKGFAENTYYYWQRRLRDAACRELAERAPSSAGGMVPGGWARLETAVNSVSEIIIEINGYRIEVTAETDPELLAKVCRSLKAL